MSRKHSFSGKRNVIIKPERARRLIRKFHVLMKAKAAAASANDERLVATFEQEIKKLGGLNTYQCASLSGQSNSRGGDSSKILVSWLDPGFRGSLLEVGCLHVDNACGRSKQFTSHLRIDLNSQHPKIVRQDFMFLPQTQMFTVISLSLVVNYVPDADTRGRMLIRAHEFLEPDGLLFFVLPRACIDNSRYCNDEIIGEIMTSVGFEKQKEHKTAKQVYWLYKRLPKGTNQRVLKQKVRDSPSMNNFCITIT